MRSHASSRPLTTFAEQTEGGKAQRARGSCLKPHSTSGKGSRLGLGLLPGYRHTGTLKVWLDCGCLIATGDTGPFDTRAPRDDKASYPSMSAVST